MKLFTDSERREFLDSHIPHRLTALLSLARRQQVDPTFFSGKGDVYCASIEGAFIMLRVFLEFLGVTSMRREGVVALVQRTRQTGKGQKAAIATDVMLDCFGLPLVRPSDFGVAESLIARVHDGLSKSTAHFTFQTNHFFQSDKDFLPAVNAVWSMLQARFFLPLRESPKSHIDLPQ